MSQVVPPLPIRSPLISASGFISEAWVKFFSTLYLRAGGQIALTNIELENQQAADLSAIEADITALETLTSSHTSTVNTHTSQIAALTGRVEGLELEPVA